MAEFVGKKLVNEEVNGEVTPVTPPVRPNFLAILEETPKKTDVVKLLAPIASRWNDIAIFLGVSNDDCNSWYESKRSSTVCLEEITQRWLDIGHSTWSQLLDVVENYLKNKQVAMSIRQHLNIASTFRSLPSSSISQSPSFPKPIIIDGDHDIPVLAFTFFESFTTIDYSVKCELNEKCSTGEIRCIEVATIIGAYLNITGLAKCSTVYEIFDQPSVRFSYDFVNYELINYLIEKFELNVDISVYKEGLEEFLNSTMIDDFISSLKFNCIPGGFKIINIKLGKRWKKMKINPFKEVLLYYFRDEFTTRVWRLHFVEGCVCAVFLIPAYLSQHFIDTVNTRKDSMARIGAFQVKINDQIIFDEPDDFDICQSNFKTLDNFEKYILQTLKPSNKEVLFEPDHQYSPFVSSTETDQTSPVEKHVDPLEKYINNEKQNTSFPHEVYDNESDTSKCFIFNNPTKGSLHKESSSDVINENNEIDSYLSVAYQSCDNGPKRSQFVLPPLNCHSNFGALVTPNRYKKDKYPYYHEKRHSDGENYSFLSDKLSDSDYCSCSD